VISLSRHDDPLLRFADEEDDGTPSGNAVLQRSGLRPHFGDAAGFVSINGQHTLEFEDSVNEWSMGSAEADADVYESHQPVLPRYEPRPERTVQVVALVALSGLLVYTAFLYRPALSQWNWWRGDSVIDLPGIAPAEEPAVANAPVPPPVVSTEVSTPPEPDKPQRAVVEAPPEEEHPVALNSDGKGLDLVVNNSTVSIRPGRPVISEEDARAVRSATIKNAKPSPPAADRTVLLQRQQTATSTQQLNAASLEDAGSVRPAASGGNDETSIRRVLTDFQVAYNALDASGTKRVWPTVDAAALERVFQSLTSQHLELVNCQVAVSGATANATCSGHARIVPRDKGKATRVESRLWVFDLSKGADRWNVNSLNVR